MISAVGDHESVIRCIEAGAGDHLLTQPAEDLRFIGDVVIRGLATATALWGLGQA